MIDHMEGFLTGWKAISAFLGVSTRTAKRYFHGHHLPIHRLPGGTPTGMPHELRIWLAGAPKYLKTLKKQRQQIAPTKK